MSLSLLDWIQLGAALLAVICLFVIFSRVKKVDSENPIPASRPNVTILSWGLIIFLAVDLGLLGGRYMSETQKPIKILSPAAGQAVDLRILVTGRARIIPAGQEIWLVVSPQDSGQFFPAAAGAVIQTGGNWSSLAFVGSENDHARRYDLLAVLVDPKTADFFKENSQTGLADLPSGCLIVDQISISRK